MSYIYDTVDQYTPSEFSPRAAPHVNFLPPFPGVGDYVETGDLESLAKGLMWPAIGGVIGYSLSKKNRMLGAAIGAGAGFLLPLVLAVGLVAAVKS